MPEINYTAHMTSADAPVITKLGVVSENNEMTPFVLHGELVRVETCHEGGLDFSALVYCKDNSEISRFGFGRFFFSAYCEDEVIYSFGTFKGKRTGDPDSIYLFKSTDGITWEEAKLFERPEWRFWNTSVCKGPDGYRMAIEISVAQKQQTDVLTHRPDEVVGIPFTEFFLRSDDLLHWEWLPDDHKYTSERYCACPALRYCDGYYYMICLEALPLVRYEPYIYRTKDFYTWEIGLHNPVLFVSREDRIPKPGMEFSPEALKRIRNYFNINNCDVDLCEYKGQTHIFYLTGDQLSYGCMCEALYDGPLDEFLQSFFK